MALSALIDKTLHRTLNSDMNCNLCMILDDTPSLSEQILQLYYSSTELPVYSWIKLEIVYVARKINIGKLSALQRVKSEMFMYIDSGKNLFPTILTFPPETFWTYLLLLCLHSCVDTVSHIAVE